MKVASGQAPPQVLKNAILDRAGAEELRGAARDPWIDGGDLDGPRPASQYRTLATPLDGRRSDPVEEPGQQLRPLKDAGASLVQLSSWPDPGSDIPQLVACSPTIARLCPPARLESKLGTRPAWS